MCGGQVSEHLEKTEYKMNKLFPGIFAMAIIVVASNILVQFFIGNWLTWGAFTYPFAFLVTDLVNRMYGPSDARRVVFFGFIFGIVCSLIGTQISIEIAPDFMAPAVTIRIAIIKFINLTQYLVKYIFVFNIFVGVLISPGNKELNIGAIISIDVPDIKSFIVVNNNADVIIFFIISLSCILYVLFFFLYINDKFVAY